MTQDVERGDAEWLSQEPFTDAERDYLTRLFDAARKRPGQQNCHKNALEFAVAALDLPEDATTVEYGEGLGWGEFGATPHDVMVLNGKAVDLTWRPPGRSRLLERAVWCLENNRYAMRRVPVREASGEVAKTGVWGPGGSRRPCISASFYGAPLRAVARIDTLPLRAPSRVLTG